MPALYHEGFVFTMGRCQRKGNQFGFVKVFDIVKLLFLHGFNDAGEVCFDLWHGHIVHLGQIEISVNGRTLVVGLSHQEDSKREASDRGHLEQHCKHKNLTIPQRSNGGRLLNLSFWVRLNSLLISWLFYNIIQWNRKFNMMNRLVFFLKTKTLCIKKHVWKVWKKAREFSKNKNQVCAKNFDLKEVYIYVFNNNR